MIAKNLMKQNLVSILPEERLCDAVRLMSQHHLGGLPVLDQDQRLVGVITEGDILRHGKKSYMAECMDLLETFLYRQNPERYVQEILKVLGLSVKELMNTELITAEEETPAGELALIMLERDIDRIPILLEGKCIGVVGREDIIQAIAQLHMDEKSFSS